MTFGVPPQSNITNLFGNYLNGVETKDNDHFRVGVCFIMNYIDYLH
jgi:hypothetical protein